MSQYACVWFAWCASDVHVYGVDVVDIVYDVCVVYVVYMCMLFTRVCCVHVYIVYMCMLCTCVCCVHVYAVYTCMLCTCVCCVVIMEAAQSNARKCSTSRYVINIPVQKSRRIWDLIIIIIIFTHNVAYWRNTLHANNEQLQHSE